MEGYSAWITSTDRQHPIPASLHTILVVDDDRSALRLVARLLTEAGYAVLEANHPHRALELVREHAGDIGLLVSDVRMPRMTGVELAAEFGRLVPSAGVLLMSGYHDHQEIVYPFLAKPFTADELAGAVAQALAPA